MKQIILSLATMVLLASCSKDEDTKPTPGNPGNPGNGNAPAEIVGQWQHGTFAMADYWGYDGSYQGNPFTQTIAFDFKSDGTYEMYYAGQTNNYGCINDAFSYFKGVVQFGDSTFTTVPTEGRYRGYYSCTPQYNFNRPAAAHELKTQTYYYHFETDVNNKKWLVIGFIPTDPYPSFFSASTW
jgi:hypothetical protein